MLVNGIVTSSGVVSSTVTIHNNFISDLKAPNSISLDAIRAISLFGTPPTSNFNVYYNSIYLNASSSGANFGTTGLYHTSSGTSTTGNLNLRNNIISNESAAGSTSGLT